MTSLRALAWLPGIVLLAAGTPLGATDGVCPAPFAPDAVLEVLPDEQHAVVHAYYGIYPEPCNGGLYLVSLPGGERLARINTGWWFEDFESARWESASHDGIIVTASYITGVGPTGVQPFRARILLTRRPEGWVPDEPELLE